MELHNITQRTPEWLSLRQKYPLTASNAQAIGNQGKGLETLVWEVLADKYSTADKDQYTNEHLERGVELESQARALYELETGNKVTEIGFATNDKISKVAGCSPDGFTSIKGEYGLIEIKCLEDKKHFKNIILLEIESQYMWQIQMQLLITDRKWCDYVLFNPNYKQSLIIQRIKPDKEMQDKIRAGLAIGEKLLKEIEAKIK